MSKLSDQIGAFVTIPHTVFKMMPAIGHDAFVLFCYLRYRTNGISGKAFPSYDTIQSDTGLGRRRIAKSIRILEAHDLVTREKRFGASSNYTLKLPSNNTISSKTLLMDESSLVTKRASISNKMIPSLVTKRATNKIESNKIESNKIDISAHASTESIPVDVPKAKTLTLQQRMIHDLAQVMGLDDHLNGGRLARLAADLLKQKYEPCQVISIYGAGGIYWREDWRGKKGEAPGEAAIRQTIAKLSKGVNGHVDAHQPLGYTDEEWAAAKPYTAAELAELTR